MKKQLLPLLLLLAIPFLLLSKTLENDNSIFASVAGTMDLTPVSICQGGLTIPAHNNDEVLEAGDALAFVLHNNQGASLGTVFAIQFGANPVFEMNTNMSFNTTYYLSAIAGTDIGSGIVDLSDPDLTVSNGTPVVFLESIPIPLDSAICQGDTIEIAGEFYTETGNYNIVLTDTQGCDSIIDFTLNVLDPFVSIFSNGMINCFSFSVTLVSNFNGTGNVTYFWSGPAILGGNTTPSIQVFGAGLYTLEITVQEGGTTCMSSTSTFVEENTEVPIADAGPDQTLDCATGTAELEATMSPGANCEFHIWTDQNGSFINGGSTITVSEPGVYTLEAINDCSGCSNFDQVTVFAGTNPLEIGDDITLDCFNNPVVIQPNIINTNPGVTYQWTTASGNILSGANTINPTIDAVGIYTVEVDNGGCVAIDEVVVFSFTTGADAGQDGIINCDFSQWTIGGQNTSVGPNIVYQWMDANGNFIGNSITEVVNDGGTYTLLVTDNSSGCTSTDEVIVETDFAQPFVTIAPPGVLTCDNTAVTLDGSGSSTGSNIVFEWAINGIVIGTSGTVTVTNAGVCVLTVTDVSSGCTATQSVVVFFDNNTPSINFPSIPSLNCANNFTTTLSADVFGGGGNITFFWTGPNNFNSTESNPTISGIDAAGNYTLTITDQGNGCTNQATVTVDAPPTAFDVLTTEAACNIPTGIASVITPLANPSFAWNTGASSQSISGLLTGWYSITVTDSNTGCGQHQNFFVEEDISCKVTISGYIVHDPNMTCTYNASMETIAQVMVRLEPLGIYTYSDANGYYEFVVEDGDYTVEYVGSAFTDLLCPTSGTYAVSLNTNGTASTDNHFFVSRKDQDICLSKSVNGPRPGFNQFNCLMACNYGGEVQNAVVTFTHDPIFAQVAPLPNIDPINSNALNYTYDPSTFTFTWTLIDLQPGDCRKIMFYMKVPVTAMIGDVITASAKVNPISGDTNPDNNCLFWNNVVTNSYDPNDKRNMAGETPFGSPIGVDDIQMDYAIRFQNVGTDTAITVLIRDTIDTDVLDVTTIRGITASHDYSLEFEGHNVLIFRFENIYLVDSMTNEPESNGWVDFTMDRYSDLPVGTEIGNQAAIYFDYNEPIITNEIINTIESHFFDVTGFIHTYDDQEVENVNIAVTGDITLDGTSDANGEVLLEQVEAGSELHFDFEKDINLLNGVTTFDIVLIHKHIIGTQVLDSPYKMIAADANHSNHITTHDIVVIKSAILQFTDEFSDNTSWRFVDGDFSFTDPTNPFLDDFPESISIPNLENDRTLDVVGIKVGDINGSASPNLFTSADDRNLEEDILLMVENEAVRVGEEVLIPFLANDFNSLQAFQFTLEFAKEKLKFEGFEKGVLQNMRESDFYLSPSENGKVTFAYASPEVQNFKIGEPLFYLKFKILENTNLKEVLNITKNPTDAIAYDEFGKDYNIALTFSDDVRKTDLQVYPNPAKDNLFLDFEIEKESEVTLEIFNSYGQRERVIFQNKKYNKGISKEQINLNGLSSGTYFIYFKTKEENFVKRFVKM